MLSIAALISLVNSSSADFAIGQFIVLLGALFCSIYLFAVQPDRDWYTARAVAESVKTLTWRYATKSEPFNSSEVADKIRFIQTLKLVVDQNQQVAKKFKKFLEDSQITNAMSMMRESSIENRKLAYIKCRVNEQHRWYAKKATSNKNLSEVFFYILIAVNFSAVVVSIYKIKYPTEPYLPIDFLVAIAAGILSWIQAKKYGERAASYALAAHEISLIKEQTDDLETEEGISMFVANSENAFSREHTQWVARKDN